jgi:hypothetical protein
MRASPHHVQVVLGHVWLRRREVGAVGDSKGVAERVHLLLLAPHVRLGVDGNDEQVLEAYKHRKKRKGKNNTQKE